MPAIFVDSNIFLGFWSLGEGRVPSDLLLPLVDLRERILVTRQVADEVSRNKLSVFLKNSGAISLSLPGAFPDHLVKAREIAELNCEMKSLREAAKHATKGLDGIRERIAAEISSNRDLTTRMLSPPLGAAARATEEQLEAARERRERGNPPGKRTDPLGDQISWQQFLDAVKGEPSVWIVTRDRDFTEKVDKQILLNPFLRSELDERGVKTINVYDNLASAMMAWKLAGLSAVKDLDNKKLTQLEKEQADAHYPQPPYLLWPDTPWTCPKCHSVNAAAGLSAHPSQYGGWSYWASCSHCGFRFDTGEPYD